MMNKISNKGSIKVSWSDRPENYTKEAKNRIKEHFSKKYDINKHSVNVVFTPSRVTDTGEVIEITSATIENILDNNYQRELMKEWLKREDKLVEFDRLVDLDNKVNSELNIEYKSNSEKRWKVKWLEFNNFLSYGEGNHIDYTKLNGLTIVNSNPGNFAGKTTVTIDVVMFWLYGKTTKTTTNEEIFNRYSNKNELLVRGLMELGGIETVIERRMKRTPKKAGGWTVSNVVNYYDILPDGTEEIQNEENSTKTTLLIKETIGSDKDFEMLVLATEKNLEDLIGLTTTESGKVLTRLIGLEILETKEAVARKMYNEFDKKKKSNSYNLVVLETEIQAHKDKNITNDSSSTEAIVELNNTTADILNLENEKDTYLEKKVVIDTSIATLNPLNIEGDITSITNQGLILKTKIGDVEKSIKELNKIVFDEDLHHSLTKKLNEVSIIFETKRNSLKVIETNIKDLETGSICKTCNRKLDDVDNTEHIEKHKQDAVNIEKEINKLSDEKWSITKDLGDLQEIKKQVDIKNRLELDRDRLQVDIDSLRNKLLSKKTDLKNYRANEDAIKNNLDLDIQITNLKTKLVVLSHTKDGLTQRIERLRIDTQTNYESIENKLKLIDQIKKEGQIDKLFKLYIEIFGKKGLSKIVLRSVLPIINAEVDRLLDGICKFEVEIAIDDKNDVQFLLNEDGVTGQLKSGSGFERTAASLALRSVLGKVSMLPMPNFITFDEILGKVADENYDAIKLLFDRIGEMYDVVFLITHNNTLKEWSSSSITITKENHISKLVIK